MTHQKIVNASCVCCPDCSEVDWEIITSKSRKEPRHPQEGANTISRLMICAGMVFIALPVIVTITYTLSQAFGSIAATVGLLLGSAFLIMGILVIEGFGATGKQGSFRCRSCGFEQKAPIVSR